MLLQPINIRKQQVSEQNGGHSQCKDAKLPTKKHILMKKQTNKKQ